jgi:DNA-binding response OmpR family regulator
MEKDNHSDERMDFQGKTILVAEDDFLISVGLKALLERSGARVVGPVSSVEEGVSVLGGDTLGRKIDAALLDISLSDGDVYPLAQALDEQDIPFVLLTGVSDPQIGAEFTSAPMLYKPASPKALLSAIATLLHSRGCSGKD